MRVLDLNPAEFWIQILDTFIYLVCALYMRQLMSRIFVPAPFQRIVLLLFTYMQWFNIGRSYAALFWSWWFPAKIAIFNSFEWAASSECIYNFTCFLIYIVASVNALFLGFYYMIHIFAAFVRTIGDALERLSVTNMLFHCCALHTITSWRLFKVTKM